MRVHFAIPLVFTVGASLHPFEAKANLVNCILGKMEALAQEYHIHRCTNPECFRIKTRLVSLGYDPGVAERIAVYRPDIYNLIVSPAERITPDKLIVRHDIAETYPREKWFASQSQDRSLVTVYRGIYGNGDTFDPTYYNATPYMKLPKEFASISDTRVFTIDDLSRAVRDPNKETVMLRMQIPRFMLYTSEGGPWGLVYFRDMVPNDLLFISHIAFVKQGTPKNIPPEFVSLEEALPLLPRVHLDPPTTK